MCSRVCLWVCAHMCVISSTSCATFTHSTYIPLSPLPPLPQSSCRCTASLDNMLFHEFNECTVLYLAHVGHYLIYIIYIQLDQWLNHHHFLCSVAATFTGRVKCWLKWNWAYIHCVYMCVCVPVCESTVRHNGIQWNSFDIVIFSQCSKRNGFHQRHTIMHIYLWNQYSFTLMCHYNVQPPLPSHLHSQLPKQCSASTSLSEGTCDSSLNQSRWKWYFQGQGYLSFGTSSEK